jgi:hypothetical protein
LVESLALSIAGGIAGVLLAGWAVSGVNQISTLTLPGMAEIRLDGSVLAFTLAISIVVGVLFGLLPSLRVSQPDLASELRESGAGAGHGSGAAHIIGGLSARDLLVVGQISLSIVLLIGAALLIKSFARLRGVDPGFQPANLMTMKIALPPIRYDKDSKKIAFFTELVQALESLPGVRSGAVAMSLPTVSGLARHERTRRGPAYGRRRKTALDSISKHHARLLPHHADSIAPRSRIRRP